jgi:hypothetical protein
MMYACPWCERKTFSFYQKQTLGPSRSIKCGHCSRHVSVPWNRAHIAALPVIVFGTLGLVIGKALFAAVSAILLGGWIGITLGMVITAPLYHLWVPLVKPKD